MVLMNVCGMNKKPHQQLESTFANGMNYRGHENLILLNPTHRINQSVRVMCGTSAPFSGAAGREQSAHTPPAPTGRR